MSNLWNKGSSQQRRPGIMLVLIIAFFCVLFFAGLASASKNESEISGLLTDFDRYAEDRFTASGIPGMAIAITDKNRTIYSRGFGIRTIGKPDPVTPETVFQIGSMSKAFTAALCGMLVDDGKMEWNDTVISRLPVFALKDPKATRDITIGEIMTHNSGLYPFQGDEMVSTGMTRMERISHMRYLEPERKFRTGFGYVNLHFLVAGEVVHAITGNTWEKNLKAELFNPLNMTDSSADLESLRDGNNSAGLHSIGRSGWVLIPWDWNYIDVNYLDGPAGGINSNVIDYSKWLRMWLNNGSSEEKKLIKEETVRYIMHPENPIPDCLWNDTESYAHGWIQTINQTIPYPIIWHSGGTPGALSCAAMIPEEGIGIVVLTNNNYNNLPDDLCRDFLSFYEGNPLPDIGEMDPSYLKLEYPIPENSVLKEKISLDPSLYVGNWSSDIYGPAEITYEDGNLTLNNGPRPSITRMIPINSSTFNVGSWPLIPGTDWWGVNWTFEFGTDGRATQLITPGPAPNASPEIYIRV